MSSRAELLYSHGYSSPDAPFYSDGVQSRGVYDPEIVSAVYPVDEMTGLPLSDAGKIADPYLTAHEREKVMSRLTGLSDGKGTYLPSSLSDDDVLDLVPPRYVQDAVDVQKWRNYLADQVLPFMSDDVAEAVTPDSEATEESTETITKEE